MSAHVVLATPEMFCNPEKVSYTCVLPADFVLILVVEDKLKSSLQKGCGSKDK